MRVLHAYLDEVRGKPFVWGEHDCLTFTNEAWRRMHGHGWAEDWAGRYLRNGRPRTRADCAREFGFETFEQAADSKLRPVSGIPPRGALVSAAEPHGWLFSLGISLGSSAVWMGVDGLVFKPIEDFSGAWIE